MEKIISFASVDWLQLNCRSILPIESVIKMGIPECTFKKMEGQTRHFKNVHYLYNWIGEEVCTIAHTPNSPIFSPDMVLLKVNNKWLYSTNLKLFTECLLDSLKLKFVSITRIDIAVDFNTFNRGLNPEKFIWNFLKGRAIKIGKAKFKAMGETNRRTNKKLTCESLKFGKETSLVSYYLYNKTLELQQVKDKPHIRELWEQSGIDQNKDVWRLEFSIKSNLSEAIEKETGETLFNLNNLNVLLEKNTLILFKSFFKKYFRFISAQALKKDTNITRASKKLRPINLLTFTRCETIIISRITEKKESNRANKIFLKKLKIFNDEMRGTDVNSFVEIADSGNDVFSTYARIYGLEKWAEQKLNTKIN